MHHSFAASRIRLAAIAGIVGLPAIAAAVDNSPAPFLQWFESSWQSIERRTPDLFMAGYGAVWTPPPGRADQGNFSVGYDVYDRFDLGSGGNPTMYGTETGIKAMASQVHRAGLGFHVDFVMNHNGYSGTGNAEDRAAFIAAGGYPGFFMEFFGDVDGDFNSAYDYGDVQGRLAGLIDIDHSKNYSAIRNPVPGFANNIAPGTTPQWGRLANVAREENRRFYPDQGHNTKFLFDPITGEQNIPVHSFNLDNPMAGDPVEENALGYLMRNAQWLVQVVGVDGLRLDAAKHMEGWVLDYLDRAVYRASNRNLLDGSPRHVFSYSEVFDGDKAYLMTHVKKNINPNDPGRIGGNRDALDFSFHFALKNNLEQYGTGNAWHNIRDADLDLFDDGARNGSAGVKFVHNHDVYKPYKLDNVAHAYTLMLPGNAAVYFNGREFGDNRDFPKPGRDDALSVGSNPTGATGGNSLVTKLVNIRNTHGRGDYAERWIDDQGLFLFERVSSAVVGLSNRGDRGFDQRTVRVGFAPGTFLLELTGNAADAAVDPYNDIPEVITVWQGQDGHSYADIRVPRNFRPKLSGDEPDWAGEHQRGYVIYGLPTPQSQNGLELSNVSQVLAGDSTPNNAWENGRQRQTDVHVITADSFQARLLTREVRLLGLDSLRDVWADGDQAMLRLDGGRDLNGNGHVDVSTPGGVAYGFENFTTKRSPLIGAQGINGPRGDGEFKQTIDTTGLEEGYHYLTARAFRHRTDGGPAVFSEWKQVIYVDRLKPISDYDSNTPVTIGQTTYNENRDFFFRSLDQTADNMHIFLDLPAGLTDQQIRDMANSASQAESWDRDVFKKYFAGMGRGNHAFTLLTYEITGNWNVQRISGIFTESPIGRGLGDANFDQRYEGDDLEIIRDAILTQAFFNPAADFDGDGWIDLTDWSLLGDELLAIHQSGAVRDGNIPLVSQGTLDYYHYLSSGVPEPAALLPLALAALVLRQRRIQRT